MLNLNNELTELLKVEYPIIQAPMAGGVTTSKLVSEVSNSGGLGMIGAGYTTPIQIREQIREIKQLTSKPFGINLFVPSEFHVTENEVKAAKQILHSIREQLNLHPKDDVEIPKLYDIFESYMEQIKVVIEEGVPNTHLFLYIWCSFKASDCRVKARQQDSDRDSYNC